MIDLKRNPYKVPMSYGFYGGLLGFGFYLLLLFSGNSPWSQSSWMGAWIPAVSAFFVIKKVKLLNADSFFPFSSIFRVAWITILFQAIFYNVITLIFGVLLGDSALEMYKLEVIENAAQIKNVYGDELTDSMLAEMENITVFSLAFTDFILKIIGGVIVSLILAGILKEK